MTVMQQKRGTLAEWTANSTIVLAEGEIGVEIDTHKAKVGDGTSIWSALPYIGSGGLPTGGTAGQIIAKVDGTDYNATWIDNYTTDLEVYVKNNTGGTLAKGQVVYISGATGANALVSLSKADAEPTSSKTLGFLKQTLTTGGLGYVIKSGIISGIDTSSATEGAAVWLSPTTAGGWTTTKPSAPNHMVFLGIVTRSSATVGEINVSVQNGYELEELHNVAIGTLADKDLLVYETSTSLWKNKTFSTLDLLTATTAANTYLTQTNATANYQPKDADLTAIAAISATSGLLKKTAADTWTLDTNSYYLASNPSGYTTNVGTVTSVSVVSANGFAGTVATSTVTPAITLKTSVTGILLGNATTGVISAAAASDILTLINASNITTTGNISTTSTGTITSAGLLTASAGITSTVLSLTANTGSTSTSTGTLKVTGGAGITEKLYVGSDTNIGGNLSVTGNITFGGTSTVLSATSLEITDPLIYLSSQQYTTDNVDIGIFGAYSPTGTGHVHTGLVRNATSKVWNLISGAAEPSANSVSLTGVTYDTLKVGALQVTDASTTRTSLGLAIGTDVQGYNSALTSITSIKTGNWDTAYTERNQWDGASVAGGGTSAIARTTLGATTVGGNIFTLTDPSVVSWLRVNADNTVTARSAVNTRSDLGLGSMATAATTDYAALAGATFSGAVALNGGFSVDSTAFSVADATGNTSIGGTLGVTSTATVGGMLTANGGITGAAAKNMTVASLMPSSGTASNGVGVIMTASVTGNAPPTKRPDGSNLVAGDVWISW